MFNCKKLSQNKNRLMMFFAVLMIIVLPTLACTDDEDTGNPAEHTCDVITHEDCGDQKWPWEE